MGRFVTPLCTSPVPPARLPGSAPDPATAFDAALLRGPGYAVLRGLVPPDRVDAALRLLNLEVVRRGLTPEEIGACTRSTFFPHLRWEPEVLALREPVERVLHPRAGEQWADTQLLLRFPDEAREWPLTPHVDELPPWASTPYRAVAGVAVTRSTAADGCLAVWPRSHTGRPGGEPELVELDPGDVVVMHPRLGHSSTLNTGGTVRYAAYFRLLTAPPG